TGFLICHGLCHGIGGSCRDLEVKTLRNQACFEIFCLFGSEGCRFKSYRTRQSNRKIQEDNSWLSFSLDILARGQLDSFAEHDAIEQGSADLVTGEEPVTTGSFLVGDHHLLVEVEGSDHQSFVLPHGWITQVNVRSEMKQPVASFPEYPGFVRNG